mmetsp:Transcript_16764/g.48273  ORF Transcript_16764/g.48273 Transcript_16764/m.48273 type:complete len:217 (+) Transcript_16764:543-1193(+)
MVRGARVLVVHVAVVLLPEFGHGREAAQSRLARRRAFLQSRLGRILTGTEVGEVRIGGGEGVLLDLTAVVAARGSGGAGLLDAVEDGAGRDVRTALVVEGAGAGVGFPGGEEAAVGRVAQAAAGVVSLEGRHVLVGAYSRDVRVHVEGRDALGSAPLAGGGTTGRGGLAPPSAIALSLPLALLTLTMEQFLEIPKVAPFEPYRQSGAGHDQQDQKK